MPAIDEESLKGRTFLLMIVTYEKTVPGDLLPFGEQGVVLGECLLMAS